MAYRKLKREAVHMERQTDVSAAMAQKKQWKIIHKAMRNPQR